VEQVAARRGTTLVDVVEETLRDMLVHQRPSRCEKTDLPTFRGRGVQPGVDLDNSAALFELMERSDAPG
jgi:hypothetical protein